MKRLFAYISIFIFCLHLSSCKSSQPTSKSSDTITIKDFRPLDSDIGDAKAVRLSEAVNVYMESWPSVPWTSRRGYRWTNLTGWTTVIEDKILFLADNVENEPFCTVDYFNPVGMRWDLMTKCDMWIYALDKTGKINKSKIANSEIVRERLKDSICRLRLNIPDNINGKILVRKYTLLSPYNTMQSISYDYTPANIEPWIFQKDIPLVYGKYEIWLNKEEGDYKVIKLGNGNIDVKCKMIYARIIYYPADKTRNESTMNYTTTHQLFPRKYKAMKVTATVSNIKPLLKKNDEHPLGIKIIRKDAQRIKIE